MKRLKALDRYQKGILIVLAAMIVVFCGVYAYVTSQIGYIYKDALLKPSQQGENTVYSGIIDWQDAVFTVTADKEITFRLGDKTYGPYTVKEDPTAKPTDHPLSTGFEIKKGDEVLFRGGAYRNDSKSDNWMLYNEDGTTNNYIWAFTAGGVTTDGNGKEVDKNEPHLGNLLTLYQNPELTTQGDWRFYALCVFLSIVISASVIFAEELFRFKISFRVRNALFAEPSDWMIFVRQLSWLIFTIATLVLYILGLKQ